MFTYTCGQLRSPGNYRFATIGFNAKGLYYDNHPLSGLSVVNSIACINEDEECRGELSNLVYQLNAGEDVVQKKKAECLTLYRNDINMFSYYPIELAYQLPPCPCTWQQAWRDWGRFQFDFNDFYCFYQRFPTFRGDTAFPFAADATQYCCYTPYTFASRLYVTLTVMCCMRENTNLSAFSLLLL